MRFLRRLFGYLSVRGFTLAVALAAFTGGGVSFADNGTDMGFADDLSVFGTTGTVQDPDLEIKGFSVFGSTNLITHISTAAGNVVLNGALEISSDVYVVGRSTFSGNVYILGFSSAAKYYGDGSALTGIPGDNLGTHTVAMPLNMNTWNIVGVSSVNFKGSVFLTSAPAAGYGGVYVSTHIYAEGNLYADAFLVSGSTNPAMIGTLNRGVLATAAGLLGISTGVPYAALDVVSSATAANVYSQLWRNASGVVVASMTSQGNLYAAENGQVQAADTGISVSASDFGKTITVNSASAQTVTLPATTAANVGATLTIVKLGAGNVTIQAPASTYIADSAAAGTLYNNTASQTYAGVTIRLVTATKWVIMYGDGCWTTS